jgi:hypothetical protein
MAMACPGEHGWEPKKPRVPLTLQHLKLRRLRLSLPSVGPFIVRKPSRRGEGTSGDTPFALSTLLLATSACAQCLGWSLLLTRPTVIDLRHCIDATTELIENHTSVQRYLSAGPRPKYHAPRRAP